MFAHDQITQIFCSMDDFCSVFMLQWNQQLLAGVKSRYRSPKYLLINILSGLIAYLFTDKKPFLNYVFVDTKQLLLF